MTAFHRVHIFIQYHNEFMDTKIIIILLCLCEEYNYNVLIVFPNSLLNIGRIQSIITIIYHGHNRDDWCCAHIIASWDYLKPWRMERNSLNCKFIESVCCHFTLRLWINCCCPTTAFQHEKCMKCQVIVLNTVYQKGKYIKDQCVKQS